MTILFRTELKVCAKHAEGFVDVVIALRLNHHIFARHIDLRTVNTQFLKNSTPPRFGFDAIVGNLPNVGNTEFLQIFASAHSRVERHGSIDNNERNRKTDDQCDQQGIATLRRDGFVRTHRRRDHAVVVGGERHGELIFFTLLEQEDVERFFHFLLTTDRRQVRRLRRCLCHFRVQHAVLRLDITQLSTECHHQIINGGHDGLALFADTRIDLCHHRAVRR